MKIPSIAGVQNIVANSWSSVFGAWTILDHDTQLEVCAFDSFYDFGYNRKTNVVQYPIENGSFATYNKQNNPVVFTVSLVKSGLNFPFQKRDFIKKLSDYTEQAKYVDIITPSGTYLNCTLSDLSFKNEPDEGSDIILARLTISEVRSTLNASAGEVKELNTWEKVNRGLRTLVGV